MDLNNSISTTATLLGKLPPQQLDTTITTTDTCDAITTDTCSWIAAATNQTDIHIVCAYNEPQTQQQSSIISCISLPAPIAVVQLGLLLAPQHHLQSVVLIVVTTDCQIWAFTLSSVSRQTIHVVADVAMAVQVPIVVELQDNNNNAKCQIAALVAWEHLASNSTGLLNNIVS